MAQALRKRDLDADPFVQFRLWFDAAKAANLPEPDATTLATATPDGKPSARMVLLKGCDERGFVFFTNFHSRKARELADNPWAALVLYWAELDRQIRIEGRVEQTSAQEANAYFVTRPLGSRLGAWASTQSDVLPNREVLEDAMRSRAAQFGAGLVPRPPHWGGFRVVPDLIEFWQGQPDRLHDRLRYRRAEDGKWILERLAP
jgi:pyridoxamine 5'-phosphate oxidase